MNQLVNPVASCCHICGTITKPRITPRKEKDKIIQEAKWICPKCGSLFAQGIVRDTQVKNVP